MFGAFDAGSKIRKINLTFKFAIAVVVVVVVFVDDDVDFAGLTVIVFGESPGEEQGYPGTIVFFILYSPFVESLANCCFIGWKVSRHVEFQAKWGGLSGSISLPLLAHSAGWKLSIPNVWLK